MIVLEDLRLEKMKMESKDFTLHYLLVSNEKVMKMVSGKIMNPEEARDKFDKILQANRLHPELGYFKITKTLNEEFIGVAKIELKEKISNEAELGYLILPEFWGKGIAGKVAKRLIELASEEKQLDKLYAIIDPENIPSRKVLEKNGFISKEFKDFDGLPGELLELDLRFYKRNA